jgi:hypothetical protein
MTPEGMQRLNEMRHLMTKQTGNVYITINQVGAWVIHHALSLASDKQLLAAITAGRERERRVLAGDEPGTNGHDGDGDGGSGRPRIVGGGAQRISRPKVVPRRAGRNSGERADDQHASPAAEF